MRRRLAAVAVLLVGATFPAGAQTKVPVLVDTDIGTDIDDAFALALALASPEIELRGVTTVSADAYSRALIACRLLAAAGRGDVPVAAGRPRRSTPESKDQYQYGLEEVSPNCPVAEPASEFLYRKLKAEPGVLTLVTIGDLTNVGRLLTDHPEAKPWIKRIVIMGGAVRVGYNGKPPVVWEWNIRSDRKAAQVVFSSGVPLVVAPLDATTMVKLEAPMRARIFQSGTRLGRELETLHRLWGKTTPTLFDPVALALSFNERFCTMEDLRLEVDAEGVTHERPGPPNARVAVSIRRDEFLQWYVERTAAAPPPKTYVVVKPGTHPGIVFSDQELPALRQRAAGAGMAADAYRKLKETALGEYAAPADAKAAVGREGQRAARQLESMALVYQVERDQRLGRRAVDLLRSVATGIDPAEFYRAVDSDFFATEHWPKAFAFAWDWLYPLLTPEEREAILKSLERWNAALFDHTEKWWWRDASYNCGAIPVGAQGILLSAIQAETAHPDFQRWFSACFRKVRDNYFPLTWRDSGICNEGPGYAHYHKNPTRFAEAVRRTGGPDIIASTGAVNAMHYLRHQWMPQGGCGPVGDNTEYGRRVFQSIYLYGVRELGDRAGLWTFEKYTDRERIDPVELFLFYPDRLQPASPGSLDLPVSHYFEFDRFRAGNVFARSEWDNERAHWFAFVTRYAEANHTHYDMNSFLFTAFGEPFATHANIYPYSHEHHGVDFEHNLVVVDGGGMPANDRPNSAGDDGSTKGFMTGVGLGHFADYARGDARLAYADRSVRSSTPAERANRSALFVKQGAVPYIVVADDIRKGGGEHDYHWQWYTEAKTIAGGGTFDKPFLIEGKDARCAIAFLDPAAPEHDFRLVKSPDAKGRYELGLLRVNQRAVAARYLALAAAWRKDGRPPIMRRGPEVEGHPRAASLVVEGENFRDLILWQPEESGASHGAPVTAGPLKTDALMALVRTDPAGQVTGYLMGDGDTLEFAGRPLARSRQPFSVSADAQRVEATGPRRAREGLAPLPVEGAVWLPGAAPQVWADGTLARPAIGPGRMATLGSAPASPR